MNQSEILKALRTGMEEKQITAYYIPTDDFHGSEYVSDYFKCREYVSGFTGSAGAMVITEDFAGLWTDGRYFIQAEAQLQGSEITLMKMGEQDVPTVEEFLKETLQDGECLGFDGRCVNGVFIRRLREVFQDKNILMQGQYDLVGDIWKDRPALVFHSVWELETFQSGCERLEKLQSLKQKIKEAGADAHILTSLEDIAWLLNLRGSDIHCNPVFLSYIYVSELKTILFTGASLSSEQRNNLEKDGISCRDYDEIYAFVQKEISGQKILLDEAIVNNRLLELTWENNVLINEKNPTTLMKAIKNPTELANMRNAHIKDGVAVTKFIYHMKQYGKQMKKGTWKQEPITEMKAADILHHLRKEQDGFLGDSFDPIMAYGEHGAIVHYSADKESDVVIGTESFLLSDTGGHYWDGTTDITRTISLESGELTAEQKRHYTLVLKAHLRLLNAKFPKGVCGGNLDAIAREPLWAEGLDFNHGTGHGVGYLLSVHEGPNAIRTYRGRGNVDTTSIVPGMITSNEPGLYFEGKYGIRLENLIECVEEENGFYGFRALTMVPFDRDAIDKKLLSYEEKCILNSYHKEVCDKIEVYLGMEERIWLQEQTRPIE
ncbi:MAG: aminopeptidase P family protein [Lachnospiraceae bacterium]|nr:aminopeptidase P family protein [Lachnospiraceae bacterium]